MDRYSNLFASQFLDLYNVDNYGCCICHSRITYSLKTISLHSRHRTCKDELQLVSASSRGVLQMKKDVKVNAKPSAGQPQHGEVEGTGALMWTSICSNPSSDVRLFCDLGQDVLSDPQLPHLYHEEV